MLAPENPENDRDRIDFILREGKFIIDCEKLNGEKRDKDRCAYAWENLYKPLYGKRVFWEGTKFDARKRDVISYKKDGVNITISGDVVFSFKEGCKTHKKYEYYKSLIERDFAENEKNQYLDLLSQCKKMNYSLHNMSLMPCTGSLNNFKENIRQCLDRADAFIFSLNDYYERRPVSSEEVLHALPVFSKASGRKSKTNTAAQNTINIKNSLMGFLNKFDDIYGYCQEMYLIEDREFIKELIEHGKKDIGSGEDVVDYMMLAIKYWLMKDEKL